VPPVGRFGWLIISAAWLLGAFGSAALLALLYRRLHPELSFYKLWAFWTLIVSGIAAAVFAFGIV
jgi:hypothetical protein